jgi:hypothetical protein
MSAASASDTNVQQASVQQASVQQSCNSLSKVLSDLQSKLDVMSDTVATPVKQLVDKANMLMQDIKGKLSVNLLAKGGSRASTRRRHQRRRRCKRTIRHRR